MTRLSSLSTQQFRWGSLVLFVATFWFSVSVFLDLLLMPMMYESGMMAQTGFASAGYSLFWMFNRLEMLCAALILTALLGLHQRIRDRMHAVIVSGSRSRWALAMGGALLGLTLVYTYLLTPEMGALGLSLTTATDAATIPPAMGWMHGLYWSLEVLKLGAIAGLLKLCYRDIATEFAG
ncbi:MAG: hypothetical protein AAFZ80_09485 [Cyanobacteria bacterium P01_A01_bin.105]